MTSKKRSTPHKLSARAVNEEGEVFGWKGERKMKLLEAEMEAGELLPREKAEKKLKKKTRKIY